MPLAGVHAPRRWPGLKRGAPFVRGLLAHEVTLRFLPTLAFRLDTSFEHANRINEILHRPEVQRDVEAGRGRAMARKRRGNPVARLADPRQARRA